MKGKLVFKIVFLIACTILISTQLFAQSGNNNVRACTEKEIVGKWYLIGMVADPAFLSTTKDKWFYRHQVFEFYGDGKMKHLTSTKPFTYEEEKIFLSNMGYSNYEIDNKGILKLTNPEWFHPMYLVCSYVTADIDFPNGHKLRNGNVVLYSYGKDGKIIASYILEKATK